MIYDENDPTYGANWLMIKESTGTTEQTAKRWKQHPEQIPPAAAKIIKFAAWGHLEEIAGKDWINFQITNGQFFIPGFKKGFTPGELQAMFFELQELRHLRIQCRNLTAENEQLKTNATKYRAMLTGKKGVIHYGL